MPGNIFFTIRVIDAWNSLTARIINCGTLELFKNRIDCFFFKDRDLYKLLELLSSVLSRVELST